MRTLFRTTVLILLAMPLLFIDSIAESRAGNVAEKPCSAAAGLSIVDAWWRPPLVAGRPAVAYLTICNSTTNDDVLVAVDSETAGRVEIHQSYSENGVAGMRALSSLPVPAGGDVTLAPGGVHLMIFGVAKGAAGTITLHLHFEIAGDVTVQAEVGAEDMTVGRHH